MPMQLTQSLKQFANELGFQLTGCCPAVTPTGFSQLLSWIEAGFAGKMTYLERRQAAYRHPEHILQGVRSLVMLGTHYACQSPHPNMGSGRIARYASGETDYHEVIWSRLDQLGARLSTLNPAAKWRGVVDTAPLLEREFAQLAGLGWQAKNTMLIHPKRGSYFFLAALLTDQILDYDQPIASNHCGTCTACIDACPTQAIVAPQILDARRCISYLTIELRDPIPMELRREMGDWLFGCDICQEVCPWNRFAPAPTEPQWQVQTQLQSLKLIELLALNDDQFKALFKHTPLWRPRRRGILRNAAIVLGNQRQTESIPALVQALHDDEPLVRGAAAWALGQFPRELVQISLIDRQAIEFDEIVREEIQSAIILLT